MTSQIQPVLIPVKITETGDFFIFKQKYTQFLKYSIIYIIFVDDKCIVYYIYISGS